MNRSFLYFGGRSPPVFYLCSLVGWYDPLTSLCSQIFLSNVFDFWHLQTRDCLTGRKVGYNPTLTSWLKISRILLGISLISAPCSRSYGMSSTPRYRQTLDVSVLRWLNPDYGMESAKLNNPRKKRALQSLTKSLKETPECTRQLRNRGSQVSVTLALRGACIHRLIAL